jgi:hypothetical protein
MNLEEGPPSRSQIHTLPDWKVNYILLGVTSLYTLDPIEKPPSKVMAYGPISNGFRKPLLSLALFRCPIFV